MSDGAGFGFGIGTAISMFAIFGLCIGLYGCPQYNVYSSQKQGEASLAQADSEKQVAVQTAKAKADAAVYLAQADITRAEGIAKANKIVSDSLGGPDMYLRWKYIEMLEETASSPSRSTIYIPTEAGVPILEAGKLAH